jgi:exopolysaccharide production protein ExoZ
MIPSIQILRGIAAALVVISHGITRAYSYAEHDSHETIERVFLLSPWGHIGVDIFFIISGFVIGLCVHDKQNHPSPVIFFLRRIVRIAPIYWLLTTLGFILLIFFPFLFRDREEADFFWFMASLVFLPYTSTEGINYPVLGVGWTLNHEFFFYLLVSVILTIQKRALFYLFLFLGLAIPSIFFTNTGAVSSDSYPNLISSPLNLYFLIGICFSFFYLHPTKSITFKLALSLTPVVLIYFALTLLHSSTTVPNSQIYRFLNFLPFSALIFLSFLYYPARFSETSSCNIFVRIGDASYSIYLIQVFSLPAAGIVLKILTPQYFFFNIFFLTFFSILCGYLFHVYTEKPLTKYLRNKLSI